MSVQIKNTHRKTILGMALLGLALLLPACNTTRGAGEDLEKAGEGIQRSAEKHGAD